MITRPCIIGTAGHIDHGKTLLIKMLTGIDTDRLKEERERGISIELGFASLTTPSGIRCGVVDVPGHERFIRNMLAGAGGIDVILLVIAADEGVMPQTREHLDIVDLLGAHDGIVAVTKIDMVEPDWRELVIDEIRSYLAGTCLAAAPIVPVSSVTGEGKADLLTALDAVVAAADLSPRGKYTRLPIDRVFTIQGFGTVITGTLWAGALHEGDRVRIEPSGHETRIKSLEVHNERVVEAFAGQRVAVSLHAVPREEITRGEWLIAGAPPTKTNLIQAKVRCVPGSPYPIRNRLRIRFYLGSSEILGRIVPLEKDEMASRDEGFVEIRLEEPAIAERGDRFVLRSYSPMRTIGGGVIVDVSGVHRRRFHEGDLSALRLAAEGSIEDRIAGTIARGGSLGAAEGDLPSRLGQPVAEVSAALATLVDEGRVKRIGRGTLVIREAVDAAGTRMSEVLLDHQKRNPLRWGLLKSELKSRLDRQVHPELIESWIRAEQEAGRLHVRGDRLRYGAEQMPLSPRLEALRERISKELEERGFAAPTTKELIESLGSVPEAEELITHLIAEGEVTRIPPDLLYPGRKIDELRGRLRDYFAHSTEMQVASLKDMVGISRKQAVPLLEFFDRQRWTERKGDVRIAGPRLQGPPA
jgi:selenocysteine-specific elongation factor